MKTRIKEIISNLTLEPIATLYYGVCIIAIWTASIGSAHDVKLSVVVLGILILLRAPLPLQLKGSDR